MRFNLQTVSPQKDGVVADRKEKRNRRISFVVDKIYFYVYFGHNWRWLNLKGKSNIFLVYVD